MIGQIVEYAATKNYSEKKVIIYAYSAGGYQVQKTISELKAKGINVSGVVIVDAFVNRYIDDYIRFIKNIGQDVPVHFYATHDPDHPISTRTEENGAKLANENENDKINYDFLEGLNHSGAGSQDFVLTDIVNEIEASS
jgi:hypothetical protein